MLKNYSMHIFGFIAFLATFSLGIVAFVEHSNTTMEVFVIYLPYGVLIFVINIIYLKVIRLSREGYEEKLRKEKEYSQSLLKYQKHFLRHAVHETNTPLAVIMANIELYEMEMGKHPALQNIEAATKNIYGIYDDLSYLTRKNRVRHSKQHIVLSDFVQSRVNFFDIVANQSGISMQIIDQSFGESVFINETKLQRIVDNNITNAIKYTQEEETITILIYLCEKEVVFEISSNSTMIEDTKHIFDAYYREDYNKEGLGLGLHLVKSICDQEGINITLISSSDKTTFTYYIPKEVR